VGLLTVFWQGTAKYTVRQSGCVLLSSTRSAHERTLGSMLRASIELMLKD